MYPTQYLEQIHQMILGVAICVGCYARKKNNCVIFPNINLYKNIIKGKIFK